LFRGASYSVKSRDPIQHDRMIDFAIGRLSVNAANKNKRILIGRPAFGRRNQPPARHAMKEISRVILLNGSDFA
jgi:hypothetical protein